MKFRMIAFVFIIFTVFILGLLFLSGYIFNQTKNSSHTTCNCNEGECAVIPIFSPTDSEQIFDFINNAKHEIKVEVYEFSYRNLADALVDAKERNVSVKVILEQSVYQNSNTFNYLLNRGIDVNWASKKFHNTHSKFVVIDGSIVFVGSLNWSENALKFNREASVIIYSKETAGEFERIFDADFNS
jgi:phosphatidylserine/phosphatidylglycerophosphate/cardiolipin synthase-like enzyme